MATARIEKVNGWPTVCIDGVPYPFTQAATVRTHNRQKGGLLFDSEYFKGLGDAGIKVYYVTCDTEWCDPGTVALFQEECQRLLEVVPDAYIMVRIGLHPSIAFTEENPEECFTYDNGEVPPVRLSNETFARDYPHLYSMASSVWREKAREELLKTCDAFDALPFADRIIGYFFAAGGTSEWYYLLSLENGERYGDFSEGFRREYEKYLRDKYQTVEALREAWRDDAATFENPKIPTIAERFYAKQFDMAYCREDEASAEHLSSIVSNGTNVGNFLDVDTHMHVFDFYRAWHLSTALSQIYFASAIKERYNGEKLTGAFYGSNDGQDVFDPSTAAGLLEILNSDSIDFLAAPGVYVNRQPGGFTGQREMPDSFVLRNKLFIVEEDTRTHLEVPHFKAMFDYYDIDDTREILERDFGRNLCENLPAWWYDHHVGGGRYKDESIYKVFAKQTEIAKDAIQLPDRKKGNEIALIYDQESIHVISNQSSKEMMGYFNNYEVARIGAGVDRYFHNDLANPDMPDYKLYVFLNTLALTDAEREVIHNKLKKNNAVALWVYGSGAINLEHEKRLSAEYVTQLTGIKTVMLNEKHHTKFRVQTTQNGIFDRLNKRKIYGVSTRPVCGNILVIIKDPMTYAAPLFVTKDERAQVAAKFLTNDYPAITVKDCDGFRSVFCASKILNSDIVREVARFAGCHIWFEGDDVFYASDNYVCIHASTDGEKEIHFKTTCTPYEVYEERDYAQNVTSLKVNMCQGQTLTFLLKQ